MMRLSGLGASALAQLLVPALKTSAPLAAVYLTAWAQAHCPGAASCVDAALVLQPVDILR